MAGDWIKFELATSEKPEVWRIAQELGIDPDAVIGKLLRVWGWFDQHTEDGNAPSVTKMLLDRSVGVTGFCEAMTAAGWMTDTEDGIGLPNFDRNNGKTAKNRALTAQRVARHKRSTNAEGNGEGNAESVTSALPREEKRREEDKNPPTPRAGGRVSNPSNPYPVEFEAAWAAYPQRDGGNSKKGAFKAWQARVRGGADPGELVAGASRYAQHVRAEGKEGSRYVMQAATFFGPDDHYAEPWAAAGGADEFEDYL